MSRGSCSSCVCMPRVVAFPDFLAVAITLAFFEDDAFAGVEVEVVDMDVTIDVEFDPEAVTFRAVDVGAVNFLAVFVFFPLSVFFPILLALPAVNRSKPKLLP